MQVAFETLTEEWVALSDIITVDAGVKYLIQNRGPNQILSLEASSEPESLDGNIIHSGDILIYEKGTQCLYLKAYNDTAQINITKED